VTRTIVIGGVGPTLGESLAREFAAAGDRVALWARSESFTAELAATLSAETPGSAIATGVDVTDREAIADGVERVHEAFGRVDAYVHNVAPDEAWKGPLTDEPGEFATYVEAAGYGLVAVVDELLDELRAAGGTVIHHAGDDMRWVSRAMAEQLTAEGVHVVRVVADGWIDGPTVSEDVPDSKRIDPDALAAEYRRLVEQDRSVWSSEVDFRAWGDDAFRTG